MTEQLSILTTEGREKKLSQLGDSLEKLYAVIDWESFRPALKAAVNRSTRAKGGRPPYDEVFMFKILILQRIYNLSDDQTEYQINDRISFMRFLNLDLHSTVPDAKTIWLFRETLANAGAAEKLFKQFGEMLEKQGLITHTGSIVDASFVDAPKPHITNEERETLKSGEIPQEWQGQDKKHKNKLRQMDTDGRFGMKYNQTHFGYKETIKVDAESKLINNYEVTPANVEDNQSFVELLDENDKLLYGDKGYVGKNFEEQFPPNVKSMILEKAQKNKPLTEEQKESNRIKSKVRARVEHVFGFMTNSLHGMTIRSKGMKRARFSIGIMSLIYNFYRYALLKRPEPTKG